MNGRAWLALGFGERLLKKNRCEWSAIDFFFCLNKLVTIVVKERQQGKYIFVEVDFSLIFLGLCSSCSRFV